MFLRPLASLEKRVKNPNTGASAVVHQETAEVICPDVLGPLEQIPLATIVPDRCSISYAAVHFGMAYGKLMLHVAPDEFHDRWNDVKNALKQCSWYAWGTVCMLTLVHNAWRMPFGSRAFAKVRQEVFAQLGEHGVSG